MESSPLSCGLIPVVFPPLQVPAQVIQRAPCSEKDMPPLTPNPTRPRGLVLLSHPHVRRCCRDGKDFSDDTSVTPMSPATMNPGFLRADGLIEFDSGLDKRLVDLLVDKPQYNVMLDKESITKRTASSRDKIRVALVDLTGDKICKPGFAGWGSTTPIAGGSTAKIGIVYAAHQFLFDLNEMARIDSIGTAAGLKTMAMGTWSGLTCKPDLTWLVTIDESATPVKAKASENLSKHLKEMVDATFSGFESVSRASELILRLGFEYIASVTWQSGLRHPTREGLWIGNTYTNASFSAKSNPACHSGTNPIFWNGRSSKNPLRNTLIALTALSAGTFFTMLAQRRLVNKSASAEMERLLATGCDFVPSLPGVTVRASKCGLVVLPKTASVQHDAALLEASDRRYVLAVLTTNPSWSAREDFIKDLDRLIRVNNRTDASAGQPKP